MTAEEIRARQARCRPHLLRLRMLAGTVAGRTQAPAEIRRAASAVMAEVTAAGRAPARIAETGPGGRAAEPFLGIRLVRLAEAAEEAAAAARDGNAAAVRRHVRRFETLTSAVWIVQHVLHGASPRQAVTSSAHGARQRATGPGPAGR